MPIAAKYNRFQLGEQLFGAENCRRINTSRALQWRAIQQLQSRPTVARNTTTPVAPHSGVQYNNSSRAPQWRAIQQLHRSYRISPLSSQIDLSALSDWRMIARDNALPLRAEREINNILYGLIAVLTDEQI